MSNLSCGTHVAEPSANKDCRKLLNQFCRFLPKLKLPISADAKLPLTIERIALAKLDGTMMKVVNHIQRNDLVIFDDFGLQPLDNNSRLALLQILEDCYMRKSVIVTSQLPVAKWYDYINEPTIADAIMDRLTAGDTHRIELKGDSLRRKKQK